MKETFKLSKNVTKYVIPFALENGDVKLSCESISGVQRGREPLWKKVDFTKTECDLYDAMQAIIAAGNETAIGHAYEINSNLKKRELPEITGKKKDSGDTFALKIKNCGFYFFEGGIGFFWYEVIADGVQESDEFLKINNAVKELSYLNNNFEFMITKEENYSTDIAENNFDEKTYRAEYLSEAEKQNAKIYVRDGIVWVKYRVQKEFTFKEWIQGYLEPLCIKTYFSSRIWQDKEKQMAVTIPDKALVFSSVLVKEKEDIKDKMPIYSLVYHLGRGYTAAYKMPEYYKEEYNSRFLCPFENSVWYSSHEGCAHVIDVREGSDNEPFFTENYWERLHTYFFVYIMVLQQHYSLLDMNQKLAELPKHVEEYSRAAARKQLKEYKEEMAFFFMNYAHLKVSHITQQNMFYEYLKNIYGIDEMTAVLREKVELINDMADNWQQKSRSRLTKFLSIVGSVFVFIQTLNNILGMYELLPVKGYFSLGGFAVATLIASVIAGLIIVGISGWFSDRV